MTRPRFSLSGLVAISFIATFLAASPANAATIWADWSSFSIGPSGGGSASGMVGGVNVLYSGQLLNAVVNGASTIWVPNSSFSGGTVTTGPDSVGDDLRLSGTTTGINSITFGAPVENPVMAFWSLGQPSFSASFVFQNVTPVFQGGGPNSSFGGSPIVVNGNTVSGFEGNGVVQFNGVVSSITWTNTPENFYALQVGLNGPAENPIPEPMSLTLLGAGLAGLVVRLRRKR